MCAIAKVSQYPRAKMNQIQCYVITSKLHHILFQANRSVLLLEDKVKF